MQALGGKMISLKEWFDITEDEVSGSMVTDILCDWQKDRNELIRQIKNLTNKSSGRNKCWVCPSCGYENDLNWDYCMVCLESRR